ncbi:hypothetical protein Tco_0614624 [Tanacetum coccineum]
MDLNRRLQDIKLLKVKDLVQKSKIKWAIEGDENSKFFHGIINKKRSQLSIRGVFVEGTWCTDPSIVDELDRAVSRDEIRRAVWNCGENKSPGPDGYTGKKMQAMFCRADLLRRRIRFRGGEYRIGCAVLRHSFSVYLGCDGWGVYVLGSRLGWLGEQTQARDLHLTPIYFSLALQHLHAYSHRSFKPQSYSRELQANAEGVLPNCMHWLDTITVLEATVDMYMHPEKHTVNSAALFHEVYNNMGKLDLE